MRLKIEKIIPGGEGLARHEGRVVFLPNVLPGEEVFAEVTEVKKDFARARLIQVVKPSPDRFEPPCALAGRCGGCDWLHVSPEAQGRLKVEMTRDALRRVGGFDRPRLRIETGSPLGYRNRLQLHSEGSGSVGFLERGGHGFVAVKHCPVAHEAFAPLFADGCSPKAPGRFNAFAFRDAEGRARLLREDEKPDAEVRVVLLGRELVFPVRGFFQSNLEMLERLIPHAIQGLAGDTVLDAYSGAGVFAAFLKPAFRRVICVESGREALNFARRNVGNEGAFFEGRLERLLEALEDPLSWEMPDAVLVDPPREGLAPEVRAWLKKRAVPKCVYVSCNPVTLARDLKDLLAGPYQLEDLRLFDFYPQTSHVEAVAKLAARAD